MNILIIGDIFGDCGLNYTTLVLREIKQDYNIDFCIANAENVSGGNGITFADYNALCDAGIDGFTMGNHTFGKKDVIKIFENENNIIRPLNYPDGVPGKGSMLLTCCGKKICVINAMGRVNLLNIDCPFRALETEIEKYKDAADIILVDFHAEVTSEKIAMGYYLDGKATCVYGTHTHVQTADETILPKGTAYITDIGMTGAIHSVLGISKEVIIQRFVTCLPQKFEHANGKAKLSGIILDIDDTTNKCSKITRLLYTN
ncbi:MAG: TIGR00282 family metallophosphoesterase [Clostridia bacterium]|nr:TIGR00282 family metallophosphoesterase [Clostridia bacterium]